MPPMQVCVAALHVRPSAAQLNWLPQLSIAVPQAQPSWAHEVAPVHAGGVGASHWKGVLMPQNSPLAQPPPTVAQSILLLFATPQPSNTTPHSLPAQAATGVSAVHVVGG